MISTMPKSGSAPTSPNALPGGLGAILQQPGGAPKGMPARGVQQMIDMARKMSDMQLADVLAGKSMDVPQYVAMTEAMGRKSLRTAMQGAQAQQQKKPSLKDTLLAEEAAAEMPQGMPMSPQQPVMAAGGDLMYAGGGAIDMNESADNSGLAMLPAPNMMPMSMAGGGIVAFQDRGLVEDEQTLRDREGAKEALEKMIAAGKDVFSLPGRALGGAYNTTNRGIRSLGFNTPYIPESYFGGDSSSMTPYMDALEKQKAGSTATTPTIDSTPSQAEINAIRATAVPEGGPTQAQRDAFYEKAPASKKTGIAALTEDSAAKTDNSYLSKLMGLSDKTRAGIAAIDKDTQAQVLFDAMSALTGNRNLAEAGAKFGQLAASKISARGKEKRALEKEANEYDLNLARYQDALASGDKDRALQIKKMLLEHQGRMAALSQEPDTLRTLRGIAGNPQLEALYGKTAKTNQMSLTDAAKQWNDLPKENRKYYKELQSMGINNEQDYYKFVNGQLLSATIPGEGAVKRPY